MTATAADIAIVGVAGCYAGAADVRRFWQNILDKVDAVGPADAEWTGPYLDPDSAANNRIYTNRGGFLRDLARFNPADFGIMPSSIDGGEPDHYLALKLARDALSDAGYGRGGYDPERAGVILGRGTYVNRGYTNVMQHGLAVDQMLQALKVARPDLDEAALQAVGKALQKQLPPFNAEMAPGVVPNVTTGIIANRLDLMGPNYIIDAACASSLVSVELAARELHSGRCDIVLAGGVQAHTPPQLFMTFCQIGALSRGNIRPFSAEAGGTLLGEGAGMLVLKRLADAEAAGDRIYAVVKGIGTASDGRAKGLLAPRQEGEVLALRRAYEASGIDPTSVEMIEAHGTGIPLGDETEVRSLSEVFGSRQGMAPHVALGSVKSMISHCIPAAGSAALIKAALALHHKVLPPTLCEEVNPALELEKTPFYVNTETRPWVHGGCTPRRAGVNAFGFGGINAHAVLEEYRPRPNRSQVALPRQWHSPREELLLLAQDSREALLGEIDAVRACLRAEPAPSLAGVARHLAERAAAAVAKGAPANRHRLAVVAADPAEAIRHLDKARERVAGGKDDFHNRHQTVCAGAVPPPGKLAFVFPGEGAQYPGMLGELAVAWPQVREWLDFLDRIFAGERPYRPSAAVLPPPTGLTEAQREDLQKPLFEMDLASESVFAVSQAFVELLAGLGVRADMMLGHSTGENSALVASGTIRHTDRDSLAGMTFDLNAFYQKLDAEGRIRQGSLMTVGALSAEEREAALEGLTGRLWLAMDNCPNQVVLFGDDADIRAAHKALTAAGGICAELPFGRAYHTPLFAPVTEAFRDFYRRIDMGPGEIPLYSCASAEPFPEAPDAIRDLACGQWAAPVRFVDAVTRLYEDGARVFLEVGPSANLSAFVGDTLRGREDLVVLSCNSRRQPPVRHFLGTLGRLWSLGFDLGPDALFAHREVEPVPLQPDPDAPVKREGQPLNLQLPSLRLRADMLPPLPAQGQGTTAPVPARTEPVAESRSSPAAGRHGDDSHQCPGSHAAMPGAPFAGSTAHRGQDRAPAASSLAPPPAEPAPPAASATPANVPATVAAASHAVTSPGAAGDARADWVRSHFSLMQQFLQSQQRVWATALGDAVPAETPVSGATAVTSAWEPWPLLGEVVTRSASRIELRRSCRVDTDTYLADHTLGDAPSRDDPTLLPLPVVPFTFSMEMLAEAAAQLAPAGTRFVGMSEARGHRWLALEDDTLPLRFVVERGEDPGALQGRIFLEQPGGKMPGGVLVFEAVVHFGSALPAAVEPLEWPAGQGQLPVVNRDDRLYRLGMFHGPRLRGVRRITRWDTEAIEAELEVLPTQDYFAHGRQPRFQFDAALLDAAGQLAGYWLSERKGWRYSCFPFRVGAFRVYAPMPDVGTRVLCRALIRMTGEQGLEARFDLLLPDGRLLAVAEGWQDRVFHAPEALYAYRIDPQNAFLSAPAAMPLPEGWVLRKTPAFGGALAEGGGIWRTMLAHMALGRAERAQYRALPATGGRREEWLLGRIAAKEAVRQWLAEQAGVRLANADIEIVTDARGAPLVRCAAAQQTPPAISIAHCGGRAVACAIPPGLRAGVDYQRPEGVAIEDVARGALHPDEQSGLPQDSGQRHAMVLASWAAKEAVAKARGSGLLGRPQDWRVSSVVLDGRGNGSLQVTCAGRSTPVLLAAEDDGALLAVAAEAAQDSPLSATPLPPESDLSAADADGGAPRIH